MVLQGPLVNLMALTAPEVYRKFVTVNTLRRKLLYMKLPKGFYDLPKSVLLFYWKLWENFHAKGFTINPYEPCVANKTINGHQIR